MDALAALRLQIEWGADEALEDAPVDRLRAAPPPPAPLPQGEGERHVVAAPPAVARATAVERALQCAGAAGTLDELRAAIAAFDGCGCATPPATWCSPRAIRRRPAADRRAAGGGR